MALSYSLTGEKTNPSLLFLHGFMGSAGDWQEIISYLSEKYYCIAIDLPGHGHSKNIDLLGDIWSFDTFSIKLSELINNLQIKTFSLIGYSLGGRLAMNFALKFPTLISHLILESASVGIENILEREARFKRDRQIATKIKTEPIANFVNAWYDLTLFAGIKKNPQYYELFKSRLKNDPELLAKALESFSPGRQPYLMNPLGNLKMQIHLICGENDAKYMNLMLQMKSRNANCYLKVFKNSGHNVHFEKPKQFAEHLLKVLSL